MRSFVKLNPTQNGKITLSFTEMGISCPSHEFLISQICFFNAIRENKILTKIANLQYLTLPVHKRYEV